MILKGQKQLRKSPNQYWKVNTVPVKNNLIQPFHEAPKTNFIVSPADSRSIHWTPAMTYIQ